MARLFDSITDFYFTSLIFSNEATMWGSCPQPLALRLGMSAKLDVQNVPRRLLLGSVGSTRLNFSAPAMGIYGAYRISLIRI